VVPSAPAGPGVRFKAHLHQHGRSDALLDSDRLEPARGLPVTFKGMGLSNPESRLQSSQQGTLELLLGERLRFSGKGTIILNTQLPGFLLQRGGRLRRTGQTPHSASSSLHRARAPPYGPYAMPVQQQASLQLLIRHHRVIVALIPIGKEHLLRLQEPPPHIPKGLPSRRPVSFGGITLDTSPGRRGPPESARLSREVTLYAESF
jgi:hypothetical protein